MDSTEEIGVVRVLMMKLDALNALLLVIVAVLTVALRVVARHYGRLRLARRESGAGKPWKLSRVAPSALSDAFTIDPKLGYRPSVAEVSMICLGPQHVVGVTSDYEAWILAVLAKTSKLMFEFGTCTGRTAYLWARNAPPGAEIHTITLDPTVTHEYDGASSDDPRDEADALAESLDRRYLYSGSDVEYKITQIYGDSKTFDETSYLERCDLIFVDGSHARSYVESDSRKALRMIAPGGIVLWHDYRGPHRSSGVFHALNALSERIKLVQIEGTSLVAHRAEGSRDTVN